MISYEETRAREEILDAIRTLSPHEAVKLLEDIIEDVRAAKKQYEGALGL